MGPRAALGFMLRGSAHGLLKARMQDPTEWRGLEQGGGIGPWGGGKGPLRDSAHGLQAWDPTVLCLGEKQSTRRQLQVEASSGIGHVT